MSCALIEPPVWCGLGKADEAWNALRESPAHRMHLLGEHRFHGYAEQTEIGVGFHRL